MNWLLIYLGIGLVNASPVLWGKLHGDARLWTEVVFWALLWPLQLLFFLVVTVPSAILGWLGDRELIP